MLNYKNKMTQGVVGAMTLCAAVAAHAGSWTSSTQSIGGMDVWIYTPDSVSSLGTGRAAMIAMHGCAQTGTDMKDGANLEVVAEQYGMVIAAPTAPGGGVGIYGCWDYYDSNHTRSNRHNDNLITLGQYLANRSDVDPTQVYIAGLSSGATQAQVTGCLAPELFAGVGSTGGPTMGTAESQAFVFGGSASTAANLCNSWAGSNGSYLASQVWNISHGSSDGLVPYSYAEQNMQALGIVKGVSKNSGSNSLLGATEETWGNDGTLTKITYTGMDHRWAAGGDTGGGTYIDHSTSRINWGLYLGDLFLNNNSRIDTNAAPVVTLNGSATQVIIAGSGAWSDPGATASDEEDGNVTSSIVVSGDTVNTNVINASGYQVVYTATDSEGSTGSATRVVKVLDGTANSAPEITVLGANPLNLTIGDTNWSDPGATASDNEDGNLTNTITSSNNVNPNAAGSYTITYSVSDYGTQLDGNTGTPNTTTATRTVVVSQACWETSISAHVAAGRAVTSGGYQCVTVGGGDQLPDYSYTCEYLANYGGNPTYSIEETSQGYFNKVASCGGGGQGPTDTDGDGVADSSDNCPNDANADQADNDNDGIGNVCDSTPNGNGGGGTCEDVATYNYYHKTAGRAHSNASYAYFANGSNESMAGSTWGYTTLNSTDGGTVWHVGACP